MGVYEFITNNEQNPEHYVSQTCFERLDVVYADERCRGLDSLLRDADDGRLRLHNLLPAVTAHYDLIVLDTQGARNATLATAMLASDLVLSPVMPEMLAALELKSGTVLALSGIASYQRLGIPIAPLRVLFNRVHPISSNAVVVQDAVRNSIMEHAGVEALDSCIPASEAFQKASAKSIPVHRAETRQPNNRRTPSALEIIRSLVLELFPRQDWQELFKRVTGKKPFARVQEGNR
jgi:chromosome partitioning related protein ParA